MGDLITTEIGERLMPLATGAARACNAHARSVVRALDEDASPGGSRHDVDLGTTEYADLAEAFTHEESLELELRGADGLIVPTESIAIQDTHFLLELVREIEEDESTLLLSDDDATELAADIEHDAAIIEELFENEPPDFSDPGAGDEPWQESPYPRYQIMVRLLDDDAIP